MFYYLHYLTEIFSPLRMFRYVTFRTFMAAGTAFLVSLLLGPYVIRRLRQLHVGQQIREDIHDIHARKQGTPTMGGVLIVFSVLVATLLWAQPLNFYVCITLATLLFMGGVGFVDDYLSVVHARSEGLTVRQKLLLQLAWAMVIVLLLRWHPRTAPLASILMVPFLKTPILIAMPFILVWVFVTLIMVGSTNAVNLTDGLDGLAIGCTNSAVLAYTVLVYVAGHAVFADYLQVPFVQGASELTVFCGALLGAGLGFLWYNCHPARVFMGDTGSLALGGSIAMIAILIKQELLLPIVGGVFVIEAASVLLQVGWFKYTRRKYGVGRRLFKRAPLHHHFELIEKEKAEHECRDVEVVETMISTRFWILSIIFALIGIATLKIR